jgi:hypothetical protein
MKTIFYGGESFLTSDEAADALLRFAARLATTETAEVVAVPSVGADGVTSIIELVIGPASELMSVATNSPYDAPDAAALVADLIARGKAAGDPTDSAVASPHPLDTELTDEQLDELG